MQVTPGTRRKSEKRKVPISQYHPDPGLTLARQAVTAKQSIVSLFLSRFTLTEEEVEAMISRDVPIGQRFFSAMDKTENIRQDCQVLMAGEEGPTQAGFVILLNIACPLVNFCRLDIMTATSSYMEQAYEKIFRWCSYEFRQMAREVQIEVTPTIREGVNRLRQRTELLKQVSFICDLPMAHNLNPLAKHLPPFPRAVKPLS